MKIRNVSGEDRYIPSLYREVKADTIFEVPDAQAAGLISQPNFWAAVPDSKSATPVAASTPNVEA